MRRIAQWLLAPERVARDLIESVPTRWYVALGWVVGTHRFIDRAEFQSILGRPAFGELFEEWSSFWSLAIGTGLLFAPVVWWVGGAWYWLRLVMSGAKEPLAREARRLNLLASAVAAFPVIALTLVQTARYERYSDASTSSEGLASVLVFALWSSFVSHRAAIATHTLRPRAALFWFLLVPVGILASAFVFGVVRTLRASA